MRAEQAECRTVEWGVSGASFILGIINPNQRWEDLGQIMTARFIHRRPGTAGGIRLTNTSLLGQITMPSISLGFPVARAVREQVLLSFLLLQDAVFLFMGAVPSEAGGPGNPFLSRSLRNPMREAFASGETQVKSAFTSHLEIGEPEVPFRPRPRLLVAEQGLSHRLRG